METNKEYKIMPILYKDKIYRVVVDQNREIFLDGDFTELNESDIEKMKIELLNKIKAIKQAITQYGEDSIGYYILAQMEKQAAEIESQDSEGESESEGSDGDDYQDGANFDCDAV